MKKFALAALFAVGVAGVGGCGIEAAVDCRKICSRYQSCFESNYDLAACESRCRSNSASDTDYKRKADQCSACIDERSCASATFNCAGDCNNVVP